MAQQQIVVQHSSRELQVAVLEDGRLADYFVQRSDGSPVSGSIYRGVVESVLPGMQAAFVDIGWERNAYLALEDVELETGLEDCKPNIGDVLKAGQSLVVQIKKEAVDAKGPKVSCKLSLPGHTLVLVPGKPYAAVSKKIAAEKRQNLKELADELLVGQQCGLIVRTAGQNCSKEDLRKEFQWLLGRWQHLQQSMQQTQKPGLIQVEQDLAAQVIRDYARESELEGIYVNDFALYEQLQQQIVSRQVRFKIRWREENLIERFALEGAIRTIHRRKIWLKNGGYLVFDRTEALNVIDVNTGKFTGKQNLQSTILQMNLEAAAEIAWQIRLRNLSGIILIDFIDMQEPAEQQQVLDALETALCRDPVKTTVLGMTQLGLVEMTRKKMRAPLTEMLEQPCPFCQERGRVSSAATVGLQILEGLENETARAQFSLLTVECHPTVAAWLIGENGKQLAQLEQQLGKKLLIQGDCRWHMDAYRIECCSQQDCGHLLPVYKGEILQLTIEDQEHGESIGRLDGYVIRVEDGGDLVPKGSMVTVEITHVMRTHALARLVREAVIPS